MTNEEFYEEYLSRFSYEDVEGLENANLNLELYDYLIIAYEDNYTGDQTYYHARIVIDEYNSMPCFIVEEDVDDKDDSGTLQGIYETLLDNAVLIKVSRRIWEQRDKK